MDRSTVLNSLARKSLNDEDFERVNKFFPMTGKCPTCNDEKVYRLNGEEFDCDCDVQRLLQKHYFAANIPKRYHDICLNQHFIGADREDVLRITNEYLENFDSNFHFGLGITFAGWLGSGKTFAMTSILKDLLKQGRSTYFITFEELINVWGASYSDEVSKRTLTERLQSVDILGLDELRTDPRNAGGFLANGLDNVIRHRTANRIPTLITTNMIPEKLEQEFPKVASLLSEANDWLIFTGKDVRGGEINERTRELAKRGERRPIC